MLFYLPRVVWLSLEGGLMKFLVRNARGKIIEDAVEKRDALIVTFRVSVGVRCNNANHHTTSIFYKITHKQQVCKVLNILLPRSLPCPCRPLFINWNSEVLIFLSITKNTVEG